VEEDWSLSVLLGLMRRNGWIPRVASGQMQQQLQAQKMKVLRW